MADRQVTFILRANTANFTKGLRKAQYKFRRFGRKLESAGRSLTRGLTVPLGLAGGASIKMASDFEASMTKIETLVGLSRQSVQGMKSDVLALAKQTGRGPRELADALFAVTSAGLRGEQAMSTLEKAAKASAIGLGDTKDVARALTGVLQSYSKQGLTAAEATDTLIGIVREGNLEASELAPVLGRVTGIASQLGISFKEVGASIASFTRLGVSSEEAVTGLRGIMNALLKQTPKASKALQSVGLTFDSLTQKIQKEGLAQALVDLMQRFKGNQKGLAAFAGRVRGLAAIMGTAGAQSESYLAIAKRLKNENGLLAKAFTRVSETMQFKFLKAWSDLKTAAIEFGSVMLPTAKKVIDFATTIIDKFTYMSDKSRKKILKLAGLFLITGPVVFAIGKFVSVLGSMIGVFRKVMKGMVIIATSSMGRIGIAFLAGLAIGQHFVNNMKALFSGNFDEMHSIFTGWADAAVQSVQKVFGPIADLGDKAFSKLADGIGKTLGVQGALKSFYSLLEGGAMSTADKMEALKGRIASITDEISRTDDIDKIKKLVKQLDRLKKQLNDLRKSQSQPSTKPVDFKTNIDSKGLSMPSLGSLGGKSFVESLSGSTLDFADMMLNASQTYSDALDGMIAKGAKFKDATAAALAGASNIWSNFKDNFKAVGQDFSRFIAEQMTAAITSFAESVGTMFSGADKGWRTAFEKIIGIVLDFAKTLGEILIAIGSAMAFTGILSGPGGAYIAAGAALVALSTGFQKGIEKRASNRQDRANNAPGMAMGGIVPSGFPNDTYPAMLTSGEMVVPQPHALPNNLGGSPEYVQTSVYLDSVKIATALNKAQKKTR